MSVSILKKLTRQLYPSGRAFRIPDDGNIDLLNSSLCESEARFKAYADSVMYGILPDNSNFTADDASNWERRLGLPSNSLVSLADRKLAIERKMNHPGDIKARQHYLYLQGQLQAAGFDLYVYENRFALYPTGYETRNPLTVSGGVGGVTKQHGQFQHGQLMHGQVYDPTKIIVNSIEESIDARFNVGSNLRSTFFIGANPVGTFANVDVNRKTELRQLILKIKPVQTVAYLFVNFV